MSRKKTENKENPHYYKSLFFTILTFIFLGINTLVQNNVIWSIGMGFSIIFAGLAFYNALAMSQKGERSYD